MTEFTPVITPPPENLDLDSIMFSDSIPPLDPLFLSASDPLISDLDFFLNDENADFADMDFGDSDDFFDFNIDIPDDFGSSEDQKPEEIVNHSNFDSSEARNDDRGSDSVHSQVSSQGSKTFVSDAPALSSPESSNLGLHQKSSVSKRKKENGGESRSCKYRKSDEKSAVTNEEDDDKKKIRLIRNRESAQLSRLRKKQYVEDLQLKLKSMHSTITELNTKITYVMAENAVLRQQMAAASGAPPMNPYMAAPPLPYQWMPYTPYPVRGYGSQTPLVPIPKLKPQPVSRCRPKKTEAKSKLKKVASVSVIGIMFFIFLFSTLVPFMNVNYGGDSTSFGGLSSFEGNRYYDEHKGKVLMVGDGSDVRKENGGNIHPSRRDSCGGVDYNAHPKLEGRPSPLCNASEPLFASLYVPRNDELVKIDGNLIIHSVLASEKAMAYAKKNNSETLKSKETELTIPGALSSALAVPEVRGNAAMLPQSTALSSGSPERKRLQQWFHEGGSGAIVSAEHLQNITIHKRMKNRRILENLPVSLMASKLNITGAQPNKDTENKSFHGKTNNKPTSSSSMVVSVLLDPREIVDSETDRVIPPNPNSLSRIFVVVLLDSVKYVTYSCVLPRSGLHLVTT